MNIRELHDARQQLTKITAGITKLGASIDAMRTQDSRSLPPGHWGELRDTVRALTKQLQPVAPYLAQLFDGEASLVEFVKVMFETVGYDPEIRRGALYVPLSTELEDMTWDEYFGGERGEEHE